ncbi:hypothetical protein D5086_028188 [Populus alba]|uniref:Uncharacterized protein n=1 Tax=Populus alba TaxID=43335 RepID=A0ACC4AXF6_POPAL
MRSNMAFNRFKWVNVSGLPLAMWNKDFISNILAAQGKLIGYDLNNVGHNYISGITTIEIGPFSGPKVLSSIQHIVDHTPESESEDEDDIMSLHNSGVSNFSNLARCYEPFSWVQTSHGSAE